MGKLLTRFKISGTDRVLSVRGQEARSLNALVVAGDAGITSAGSSKSSGSTLTARVSHTPDRSPGSMADIFSRR
jgi:hypothetical protein